MFEKCKTNFSTRVFTMILSLTLLFSSFNLQNAFAAGTNDTKAVTRLRELEALRTENTTVYLNSDGTRTHKSMVNRYAIKTRMGFGMILTIALLSFRTQMESTNTKINQTK